MTSSLSTRDKIRFLRRCRHCWKMASRNSNSGIRFKTKKKFERYEAYLCVSFDGYCLVYVRYKGTWRSLSGKAAKNRLGSGQTAWSPLTGLGVAYVCGSVVPCHWFIKDQRKKKKNNWPSHLYLFMCIVSLRLIKSLSLLAAIDVIYQS
jgi:hypothetical protein